MSLATLPTESAKPRRRQSSKVTEALAVKPAKLSIYVHPEVAKRLGVHSVMTGKSQSAIVEQLIRESLRRYVVSDRGKSAGEGESADLVIESALPAA